MNYALARIPHSNSRYDLSLDALFTAEFAIIARAVGIDTQIKPVESGMITLFEFDCPPLTDFQLRALAHISSLYSIFEKDGALLKPVGKKPFVCAAEMPSILKYKGKTNEMFTRMLINIAVFSGEAADRFDQKLSLLDPLAGKGTTLFCALGYGYDSFGIERDKKEVDEAVAFAKEYFMRERMKHDLAVSSVTVNGKNAGTRHNFSTAVQAQDYKKGQTISMVMAVGDTLNAPGIASKTRFDMIVADLPYGIQHGTGDGKRGITTLALVQRALPAWSRALRSGGTVVLSFNNYTIKRDDLRDAFADAGLFPLSGGAYDAMEHWVEQAVMRDVVVAVKE